MNAKDVLEAGYRLRRLKFNGVRGVDVEQTRLEIYPGSEPEEFKDRVESDVATVVGYAIKLLEPAKTDARRFVKRRLFEEVLGSFMSDVWGERCGCNVPGLIASACPRCEAWEAADVIVRTEK